MRRKKFLVYATAVLIIICLLIIASLIKDLIFRAAQPQGEPIIKSADYGTYWGLPEPLTTTAERFSLVIPYPDKAAKIPQIRASVQDIMLPFNAFYVKAGDTNVNPVPWETIQANGWQLTDITKEEYGEIFNFADPGAPGYAEAWAQAAILRAQESQANWVFADSITANLGWTFLPAERPAKYPNDDLWRQAMRVFLSVVSVRVHDAGLKFGANMGIGNLPGTKPWHDEWLQFVDAPMEERFSFGRDKATDPIIDFPNSTIEQQINVAQSLNKSLILVAPGRQDDPKYEEHLHFSLSMYLIARKPQDWFIFYNSAPPEGGEITFWHPDFEQAKNLGEIKSAPAKADNIWYRIYDQAVVLLNATDNVQPISQAIGPEAAALGTLPARTGKIVYLNPATPTPTTTPTTTRKRTPTPSPSNTVTTVPTPSPIATSSPNVLENNLPASPAFTNTPDFAILPSPSPTRTPWPTAVFSSSPSPSFTSYPIITPKATSSPSPPETKVAAGRNFKIATLIFVILVSLGWAVYFGWRFLRK